MDCENVSPKRGYRRRAVDAIKACYTPFSTYFRLLVFGNPTVLDIVLLVVGFFAAIASGVPFPLMGITFGHLVDKLNSTSCNKNSTAGPSYQHDADEQVLNIIYIGIAYFVAAYLGGFCWSLTGERLAQRLRERYFKGLLRQEIAFFDGLHAGEASARLTGLIAAIQQGTSEKASAVLNAISFFVTAYIIAFIKNTTLAGMLVSLAPAYLLMTLVTGHYIQKHSAGALESMGSASSVAMEALSNITIVHSFNAGARLESKFAKLLQRAMVSGVKKAIVTAVQLGLLYSIAYAANALAYWQGSKLIANAIDSHKDNISVGSTHAVIFILVDASIILSQAAPFLHFFSAAAAAFQKLEKDMTRQSRIDGTDDKNGVKVNQVNGCIELRDVSLSYNSQMEQLALKSVSFRCPARKRTAIVGLSGSGKSTIAALMLRLYDPTFGCVLLDGCDLKTINVASLRSHLSIVQQDSSLLDRSILENIALGLINSPHSHHLRATLLSSALSETAQCIRDGDGLALAASKWGHHMVDIAKLVEKAATEADATSFIEHLQNGYGSVVGSNGTYLSGGQKQRVALARALVKDPRVLILDEATASLDSTTELRVQKAIDQAATGRTVITITHRLSTVKDADNIIVIRNGQIVEQGSHSALLAKADSEYADLIELQQFNSLNTNSSISEAPKMANHCFGVEYDGRENPPTPESGYKTHGSPRSELSMAYDHCNCEAGIEPQYSSFKFLKFLFRPYLLPVFIALIAVVIVGGSQTAVVVVFGKTIGSLNLCLPSSSILSSGRFYGLLFFVLSIATFLAHLVSGFTLGWVAEKVQFKARVLSFRSLMEHNQDWHETGGRSSSRLLAIITKDGNALGSLTGSTLGSVLAIMVNMLASIILAPIIAWRIALVCLSVVPLMIGAGIMRVKSLLRFEQTHATALAQSIGITVEAVNSIRTVASYSLEDELVETYRRSLRGPIGAVTLHTAYATLWLAIAYAIGNFVYALAYWWGTKQLIAGNYSPTQFFIVMVALLSGAQMWATVFNMASDGSRARGAIKRMAEVVNDSPILFSKTVPRIKDRTSIDDIEHYQSALEKLSTAGKGAGASVIFQEVHFSYPARPNTEVLRHLNMTIQPGQFAALVGPSGAGKSTIVSLIERLYLPTSGAIKVDGYDITRIGGTSFRDNIAFVPQDSVLFEGSIRFNVALGARPGHEAADGEIVAACRLANIHDTIMKLPKGYDTNIGPNGGRLSGGQKQRLAIARALVRNPRLLLLDESTSALDAESERLLQDGLDEVVARGNVTVIAIAHRLRTIQKANIIFLIDGGRCIDRGTHDELMNRSEAYRLNAMYQTMGH